MHYAVVRRRAKLSAQHRVIFAIPYNAMQYNAMQYHAMQSKTIQYMQYKEIPCNTLFKSFETPIGPPGLDSCSPHTLTWYRAPSGSLGAQKGPILAQISMAPFLWDIFSKYSLVGCPEHHNGTPCSSSTVTAHMEPSSLRKLSKINPMGQNIPFLTQFQTT